LKIAMARRGVFARQLAHRGEAFWHRDPGAPPHSLKFRYGSSDGFLGVVPQVPDADRNIATGRCEVAASSKIAMASTLVCGREMGRSRPDFCDLKDSDSPRLGGGYQDRSVRREGHLASPVSSSKPDAPGSRSSPKNRAGKFLSGRREVCRMRGVCHRDRQRVVRLPRQRDWRTSRLRETSPIKHRVEVR